LDLSAELRNQIYESALTFDLYGGCRCTSQLLATCKQISTEATSYLYDNTVIITLDSASQLRDDEAMLHIFDEVKYILQPQCKIKWPPLLRKFRSLSFMADNNVNSINEIEMVLHSMFSFLGGKNSLRRLKLVFLADPMGFDMPSREPDIFSIRLLDKPNLDVMIYGSSRPQSLWTDKITGVDRNARSRCHACKYMYSQLQKFIPYTLKHARKHSEICDHNQFLTEFKYGSPGIVPTCKIFKKMSKTYLQYNTYELLRFGSILRAWHMQFQWVERECDDYYGFLKDLESVEDDEADIPGKWWEKARLVMRCAIELEVMVRKDDEAAAAAASAASPTVAT
jgi:hypothetical protein